MKKFLAVLLLWVNFLAAGVCILAAGLGVALGLPRPWVARVSRRARTLLDRATNIAIQLYGYGRRM